MCIPLFYKKVTDLNGELALKDLSMVERRRNTDILVIDDEEFPLIDTLKKHEFQISQKNDLTDLRDAEAYEIILCDIRGVGKFLDSGFDGAYLIKQLKEKYPSKTVIAYTANEYDAQFQKYLQYANDVVPKGAFAIEDWTSLLDRLIKESADPIKIWERARQSLLNAGVSTIDIAKYESDYVKAVQKGSYDSMKKIYEHKSGNGAKIMVELLKTVQAVLAVIPKV